MRHSFIIILVSILLTSCFTVDNIKKAKVDRKPQVVDSVLTSYKDVNGNLCIIYIKQNDKHIYKSVIPLDTIVERYRLANTIDFISTDTTIKNFIGVFFTENVYNEKGFQRLIYYDEEKIYTDTSKLSEEIRNDNGGIKILKEKVGIPVFEVDSVIKKSHITTKVVAFVVKLQNDSINRLVREETYIVVFKPTKKKYSRYFLTPLTVGLDAITLPGQVLFYGAMLIISNTIKF